MNSGLLEMEGITKTFRNNGVRALDAADLRVGRNEIHAVVGENGAGKSTLMHVLAGEIRHDEGSIRLNGRKVSFGNTREAVDSGIGMLHQHLQLIPGMKVWENIILGYEPSDSGIVINKKSALQRISEIQREFGIEIDPEQKAGSLNADGKQKAALLSILFHRTDILILDEPTTFFSEKGTDLVYRLIKKLKEQGRTVIIITHKLKEAIELADCITVMRAGKSAARLESGKTDLPELTELVMGTAGSLPIDKKPVAPGDVILKAEDISYAPHGNKLLRISFEVKKGEILAVTGIRENGLEILEKILSGELKPSSGTLLFKGRPVQGQDQLLRKIKAGYIPSDRLGTGSSIKSSVSDNLILLNHRSFVKKGLMSRSGIKKYVTGTIGQYGIIAGAGQLLRTLSGGNIQRVMIAREMEANPELFIFAEPSRGLDINSRQHIYNRIIGLRDSGCAILIISSDLEEALAIADRLLILYMGRETALLDNDGLDQRETGKLLMGTEGL